MLEIENSVQEKNDFLKAIDENRKYQIVKNQIKMINFVLTNILKKNNHFYSITYKISLGENNFAHLEEEKTELEKSKKEFNKLRKNYEFSYFSTYGTQKETGGFFLHRHILIATTKNMSGEFKDSLKKLDSSIYIKNIPNNKNLHQKLTTIINYHTKNYKESVKNKAPLKNLGIHKIFTTSKQATSPDIEEIHNLYYINTSLKSVVKSLEQGNKPNQVIDAIMRSEKRSVKIHYKLPNDYYKNRVTKLYNLLKEYEYNTIKESLRISTNQSVETINNKYDIIQGCNNYKLAFINDNLVYTNSKKISIVKKYS